AVGDGAVFGRPPPQRGEQIKAVVEHARAATTDELRDHSKEHLAAYKAPRSIDIVDELPRDPNGKLYKRLLRDPYWETANQG
ncbi:MAG: acyl-CoA synthetase, partial [Ilumatobacter fluminis]